MQRLLKARGTSCEHRLRRQDPKDKDLALINSKVACCK